MKTTWAQKTRTMSCNLLDPNDRMVADRLLEAARIAEASEILAMILDPTLKPAEVRMLLGVKIDGWFGYDPREDDDE